MGQEKETQKSHGQKNTGELLLKNPTKPLYVGIF